MHAYVLMTNHVHLLISSERADVAGALMKPLGQRYVKRVYRRSGTLCERGFRSCLVQEGSDLLGCQRYLELNPVRAAMVAYPAEYRLRQCAGRDGCAGAAAFAVCGAGCRCGGTSGSLPRVVSL